MSQEPNLHIQIDYSQGFIQAVTFTPSKQKGIHWSYQASQLDSRLENAVNEWLKSYQQRKNPSVHIPLAFDLLPSFTQQVLREIAKIPRGTVYTYGQIAAILGRPQAARAVGGACGRNPFLLFVPCHRVIDAKKELRGFSAEGGLLVKKSLLNFEEAVF